MAIYCRANICNCEQKPHDSALLIVDAIHSLRTAGKSPNLTSINAEFHRAIKDSRGVYEDQLKLMQIEADKLFAQFENNK